MLVHVWYVNKQVSLVSSIQLGHVSTDDRRFPIMGTYPVEHGVMILENVVIDLTQRIVT